MEEIILDLSNAPSELPPATNDIMLESAIEDLADAILTGPIWIEQKLPQTVVRRHDLQTLAVNQQADQNKMAQALAELPAVLESTQAYLKTKRKQRPIAAEVFTPNNPTLKERAAKRGWLDRLFGG